jgi:hypothetical protein
MLLQSQKHATRRHEERSTMPTIEKVSCNQCDFTTGDFVESIVLVVLDDGSELNCPHPLEVSTAEEATGKTWSELRRAGRMICRDPLLCLACGHLDYYCDRDLTKLSSSPEPGPPPSGSSISRTTAALHPCKACGKHRLLDPNDRDGCLLALLIVLGLRRSKRPKTPCPKCTNGTLRIELTGKS